MTIVDKLDQSVFAGTTHYLQAYFRLVLKEYSFWVKLLILSELKSPHSCQYIIEYLNKIKPFKFFSYVLPDLFTSIITYSGNLTAK